MDQTTRNNLLARIRRVAGQLDGVARMIEGDRPSADVLLQISSAQAALGQAGKVLLRSFVETRLSGVDAAAGARERKQRMDELMEVFARYAGFGRRTRDLG